MRQHSIHPSARFASCTFALIGSLLAGLASAATPVDPARLAAVVQQMEQQEMRSGRVSSYDRQRGTLIVGGVSIHVDPNQTAFSDDRRKPPAGGVAALRPGDRVTVRAVRVNGVLQAVQIIVND
ncbi:MAG: hypothetical protein H7A18_02180 [Sinobacteraceae bacterium]|nr:hypothetical protein [Nevskiaceae bacterium]MCP5339214.1 hypothetical protein [Nevskiaceae bacterium]MCP5359445.1 hypothetical protein [Nevskiaceae bacterium]MCP5470876.1 hypothetical protein [Nevskiaceae bacterium]